METSSQFKPVYKGQEFGCSKDCTAAIQICFLHDLKGCKSTGGGGYSKVFCCAGRKVDPNTKKEIGCRARVRACKSRRKNLELWKITEAYLDHNNCTGEQENASLASVEEVIAALVRATPDISGPGIKLALRTKGISVHTRTALRAKAKALGRTASRNKEGFTALTSLLEQLQTNSKGTYTSVEWGKSGRFKRCFVMLGGAVKVAANSPSKAFSLDGAHLRGSFNGVILTITTTDANNKINICAFAVVPRENLESYEYLLAQAVRSKRMEKFLNKETTTCFTDGQNGVDAAVTKFARGAEIRHCLQHILRGCGRMGDVGGRLAYSASKSLTKPEFDDFMKLLHKIAPDAHDKLDAIPHKLWAHHASRKNVCWDQVTTNPAESANKMLLELRGKPVYDLVHGTILLITQRLFDASELKKDDESQVFTPHAMKHFNTASGLSHKLTVQALGGNAFLVAESKTDIARGHKAHVTWSSSESKSPPELECSCGVPQKLQLPCSHVLAAVRAQKMTSRALSLISKRFKITKYRRLASACPINMPVWDALEKNPKQKPPRTVKRLDGKTPSTTRRSGKRIRSRGEDPTPRKRRKPTIQS
ncbi:unnamed protein product [Pylaiella littoralis]